MQFERKNYYQIRRKMPGVSSWKLFEIKLKTLISENATSEERCFNFGTCTRSFTTRISTTFLFTILLKKSLTFNAREFFQSAQPSRLRIRPFRLSMKNECLGRQFCPFAPRQPLPRRH